MGGTVAFVHARGSRSITSTGNWLCKFILSLTPEFDASFVLPLERLHSPETPEAAVSFADERIVIKSQLE